MARKLKARRPARGRGRSLLVRLGLVWLALAVVAMLAGVYSERVLHSAFALDAAIVGGACSAAVAVAAFATASSRRA